ncbi:MAG TPA: hypothetical protein VEK56_06490 [Vicinamibacterales bacterium]|nr:hypothetical protein [Vicinamibacterales bacterium]
MLKTIQCSTSSVLRFSATSGSCMISANVAVFGGTLVHSSFGETGFGSACVYLLGMTPPSSKAGVVSVRPGPAGPRPWAAPRPA